MIFIQSQSPYSENCDFHYWKYVIPTFLIGNAFFFVSTGHISSEKNGVSFSVQNGDVCLHDFSGKQLAFQEKDDTGSQNSRISLRRTSKRGSLTFIEKMWFPLKQNIVLQREVEIYFNSFYIMWEDQKLILFNIWYWNFKAACNVLTRTITNWKKKKKGGEGATVLTRYFRCWITAGVFPFSFFIRGFLRIFTFKRKFCLELFSLHLSLSGYNYNA